MATSKGGIKGTASKKTTSIKKGPTVGKALTAAARAVTTNAKQVAGASKKKSSTATKGAKTSAAKKPLARKKG